MPLVTSDVSFRGLFVPTTIAPALRSLVRIRMTLGVRIIDTHAMVIHIRTDPDERVVGIGLQFWGLTGTERIGWDAFVNGLLTTKRATAKRIAEASAADAAEGSTPSGVRAVTSPDSSR